MRYATFALVFLTAGCIFMRPSPTLQYAVEPPIEVMRAACEEGLRNR